MRRVARAARARRQVVMGVALVGLGAFGCETYDPPPVGELVLPNGGRWFKEDPIEVQFTEAIAPETLVVNIYPRILDLEGGLHADATPLLEGCTLASSPCGEFELSLSEGDSRLTITQGGAFEGLEGEPYLLELAGGLTDTAGAVTVGEQWFDFQVSPDVGGAAVELPLSSGFLALTSDLTDVLPSVYLRLYVGVSVDPATGEAEFAALVARMDGSTEPNATTAENFVPILDGEGWIIGFQGDFGPNDDGTFSMLTEPFDLDVRVLGIIRVQLKDLKIEATLSPPEADGERETLAGYMSASKAVLGDPGDETDLGAVGAAVYAEGFFEGEVPSGAPGLCEDDPCDELRDGGGDCQLADPWVKPAWCDAPAPTPEGDDDGEPGGAE